MASFKKTINIFTISIFLFSLKASAFTLMFWSDGSALYGWPTNQVTVQFDPSQCTNNIDSLVNTAISTWSQLDGSNLVITRGANVTTTATAAYTQSTAGTPVIVCDQALLTHFGSGLSGVLGFVTVKAKDSNAHITYAPLILNYDSTAIANLALYQTPVVQSVIAHEMGHMMGLGHTPDTNALMYPSIDPNVKTKFALAKDDSDGMIWIYPRSEVSGGLFGCGTIETVNHFSDHFPDSGLIEMSCLFIFFAFITWAFKRKFSPFPSAPEQSI